MAKDIQIKDLSENVFPTLNIKTKTFTGTTSSSGNLNLNLPTNALVLGIHSTSTDVAVIPYFRIAWWAACRKSNAGWDPIASSSITLTIYYIEI